MNILVTGAKGFVGKNFCLALTQIKNGNDKTHESLIGKIDEIFEYDRSNTQDDLEKYCKEADFVFNFAGVNRPKDNKEFLEGNFGFASTLLDTLKKYNNKAPIMLSSSTQASLEGRFKDSEYGKSKLAGENLFFEYGKANNVKTFVYRFPNLFGKWCRPNYNSAVATFCNNIANDLPIQVNDRNTELELLYIDDLVEEMLSILSNTEKYDTTKILTVTKTYKRTLGEIVDKINEYDNQAKTLDMPEIAVDSFEEKLYATYLSYLPKEKVKVSLKMNVDERGSFTEMMRTFTHGQFSVNVSKPGIKKGEHFHNTKWEYFIVVSGKALIQERKIGLDENGNKFPVWEFEVSSDKIEAVHMLPGYTHNIINLSDTNDLVTVMWISERFEKEKPDTYYEEV